MNKERGGFLKEMTAPKAGAIFVGVIVLAGLSIVVANKILAAMAA